jgi:XTP/dITP diphosphohydrolase
VSRLVVLATRNPGKLAELGRILAAAPGLDVELIGLDQVPDVPDVPETGATFAENALIKAHNVAGRTWLPALADDSGLTVAALNGMPGVLSARWAGRHGDDEANLDLLLGQLADLPDDRRAAAFVCAAALVLPGGVERVVEAVLPGRLLRERRGRGGFGYDPIFVPAGDSRTTAEMSPEDKDAISHRGQAFRGLAPILRDLLTAGQPANS